MKNILLFLLCLSATKHYAQISLNITDGSKYRIGNDSVEIYYLYTDNGTNGGFGEAATCRMWGAYITVYNKTNLTYDFFANVTVGTYSGAPCGSPIISPLKGSVGPKSSMKYRIMPDAWSEVSGSLGLPGFVTTNEHYH